MGQCFGKAKIVPELEIIESIVILLNNPNITKRRLRKRKSYYLAKIENTSKLV
jgi:hypothetical protein